MKPAIVCAYILTPNVHMCNSYSLDMFLRNFSTPGRSFVWYHTRFMFFPQGSWKWYTSWKRQRTYWCLWKRQKKKKVYTICTFHFSYFWINTKANCFTFKLAGIRSLVVWMSVWSKSTRSAKRRFLSNRSSSSLAIRVASCQKRMETVRKATKTVTKHQRQEKESCSAFFQSQNRSRNNKYVKLASRPRSDVPRHVICSCVWGGGVQGGRFGGRVRGFPQRRWHVHDSTRPLVFTVWPEIWFLRTDNAKSQSGLWNLHNFLVYKHFNNELNESGTSSLTISSGMLATMATVALLLSFSLPVSSLCSWKRETKVMQRNSSALVQNKTDCDHIRGQTEWRWLFSFCSPLSLLPSQICPTLGTHIFHKSWMLASLYFRYGTSANTKHRLLKFQHQMNLGKKPRPRTLNILRSETHDSGDSIPMSHNILWNVVEMNLKYPKLHVSRRFVLECFFFFSVRNTKVLKISL